MSSPTIRTFRTRTGEWSAYIFQDNYGEPQPYRPSRVTWLKVKPQKTFKALMDYIGTRGILMSDTEFKVLRDGPNSI